MTHRITMVVAIALSAFVTVARAEEVTVYSTSKIQLQNVPPHAAVVLLDAPQEIQAKMSRGLPAHPQQAAELIKTRRHSPEWQQLQLQLRESADDVVKAWVAGVTKVPAVTVDNKYVVYGMTDVGAALQKIRTAQGEQ